jgi:aspartate aminotransferase-like enzyme
MPNVPYESDSVTVVLLPEGLDAGAIRKRIARHTGIAVAGAQGDYWKSRMLRIGTLGFTTRSDVVRCLRALRLSLEEAGHKLAETAEDTEMTV